MGRHHHSFAWRVTKAIEHAGESRPVILRTGPAWAFGIMGLSAEFFLAPVVLAITVVVGVLAYLLLDTPVAKFRSQQRPRFVSVRILYINTVLVAGFWLAVMFTFSAADPVVTRVADQRLPQLLSMAAPTDLRSLVTMKKAMSGSASLKTRIAEPVGGESAWFIVFTHGLVCSLSVNFLLYGVVIARRRHRSRHGRRSARRRSSVRYDAGYRLFVDEDPSVPQ